MNNDVMSESQGEECKHFSGEVWRIFLVWKMKSEDTKITEPGKQQLLYMLIMIIRRYC